MTTIRTFIAIELDEKLRNSLGRIQDQLREQVAPGSVRWVRPEGIHLTLKFLGDTPLQKVEEVKVALAQSAAEVGPFTFTLAGLGCFPNTRQPNVVWVGLHEPSGALTRLRDAVEADVTPLGFPTENRPFKPHLTLGRVQRYGSRRQPSAARGIGEVVAATMIGPIGEMKVDAVCYIRSDLKPSGAVYTTLFEARLAGA